MSNKILLFLLSTAMPVFGLLSCSESEEESDEYANWQERNESYFDDIYAQAVASTTDEIDTIRSFALTPGVSTSKDDYIVVKKLINGTSVNGSPMFTDSVEISYRGRYIPTDSYPEGYVFDQTYSGDFNYETVHTTNTYFSSFVTGFATALLNMRIGDYWRVYIPYKLAYGKSGSTSILGYSTLIFDISLHAFYRPDADNANTKAIGIEELTPLKVWITE